jgi:hypothetical protein
MEIRHLPSFAIICHFNWIFIDQYFKNTNKQQARRLLGRKFYPSTLKMVRDIWVGLKLEDMTNDQLKILIKYPLVI